MRSELESTRRQIETQNESITSLKQKRSQLEDDLEDLDIQTAGFTKCRFSVLAKRCIVRDGGVFHANLSSSDPIDE